MLEPSTEGDKAFENWLGILLILIAGTFVLLGLPWIFFRECGYTGPVIYFAAIALIVLPPILFRKWLARLDERKPKDDSK